MSYYDDFGVSPGASGEEIRESYRTLVRLLHPDQQTDLALKAAAETQMRHLNERFAVLSDPDRRRRYDQELAGVAERPAPIIIQAPRAMPLARPRMRAGNLAWIGAAVASGALILWLSLHDAVAPPPLSAIPATPEAPAPPAAQEAATPEVRGLQTQLRIALSQRDQAIAQLMRLREEITGKTPAPKQTSAAQHSAPAEPAREESRPATEASVPTPDAPPATPVEPPPAPTAPEAAAKRFAGMWFYAKPSAPNKNKTLYPPVFIEALIVEENGSVHGRYRARYRVTDRPISPDVNFEFDGKVSGSAAHLAWRGDGGSRGEAHLKLISETSLEMKWAATDNGSLGLTEGTAVLVRGPE